MKRIVLTLCVFIAPMIMLSLSTYSAAIYMWTDEKGVKHITDQPPGKPVETIRKGDNKSDSPEEIQRYQAEQKAIKERREAELRQRQQIRRAQEEAMRTQKEAQKQRERLYSQITKDMSKVEVKRILGPPFLSEVYPTGGAAYWEEWTYTENGEDWVIRFFCAVDQSRVDKIIKRKAQ